MAPSALQEFVAIPRMLPVFLCFLPELTFRKKFGDKSKDGMGLSCLLLREAVAL